MNRPQCFILEKNSELLYSLTVKQQVKVILKDVSFAGGKKIL